MLPVQLPLQALVEDLVVIHMVAAGDLQLKSKYLDLNIDKLS